MAAERGNEFARAARVVHELLCLFAQPSDDGDAIIAVNHQGIAYRARHLELENPFSASMALDFSVSFIASLLCWGKSCRTRTLLEQRRHQCQRQGKRTADQTERHDPRTVQSRPQ